MVKNQCFTVLRTFIILFLIAVSSLTTSLVYSASSDGADEDSRVAIDIAREIVEKRAKSPDIELIKTIESQIPKPDLPKTKVLIKEINITGSTILARSEIRRIKSEYENKELTGRQMQRITDKITRAYSREGYITSYAYISPEGLSNGVLDIIVKEGRTGTINIRGNEFFSTDLIRKKISLQEGELFNFRSLNLDIFRLNKHADLKASIVADPNVETGIANVTINVKDRMPIHVLFQADNYGSEYILQNRYKAFLTHNNLTGHDDQITLKVQRSEGDAHQLYDFDYYIPINNNWKFNFYYMPYKVEDYYYSDNEETDFEKHARKFYFYFNHYIVNRPNFEFVSQYGFKYLDIHWYTGGGDRDWQSSFREDRFRALMWGIDINKVDRFGRWVISNDLEKGIPGIMGASPAKSDQTSVKGGGSAYWKDHFVVARRQKLFAGIDFIGKSHIQFASQSMPGVNVFSMGGIMGVIDNRGYPRAQAPGDTGYSFSGGFSFPPFGVGRDVLVPFSKTKLYDAIKIFTFYDWGHAELKSPDVGEEKSTDLTSVGFGVTFSVPDKNLSMRLDVGWPLSDTDPKDQAKRDPNFWWSITKGF